MLSPVGGNHEREGSGRLRAVMGEVVAGPPGSKQNAARAICGGVTEINIKIMFFFEWNTLQIIDTW